MQKPFIPQGYRPILGLRDSQKAIKLIKDVFERRLAAELSLERVSAPLFVDPASGMNDNLSGKERPVAFDVPATGAGAEIVHSLAKWKRMALARYGFAPGEGLYTDMNAIRRDEELDNLHSIYVDQWDWEKVITPGERVMRTQLSAVVSIVNALNQTLQALKAAFPQVTLEVPGEVFFISSQELLDRYPGLSPKERENEIVKEHGLVYLTQIGGALSDGRPHDGRAPDYDDWNMNGDLLINNSVCGGALELSSMGVRVDSAALKRQLEISGQTAKMALPFHRMLLEGRLPLTMGGGIGQSRLCMVLLQMAHIGEAHASLWPPETIEICEKAGVTLL